MKIPWLKDLNVSSNQINDSSIVFLLRESWDEGKGIFALKKLNLKNNYLTDFGLIINFLSFLSDKLSIKIDTLNLRLNEWSHANGVAYTDEEYEEEILKTRKTFQEMFPAIKIKL